MGSLLRRCACVVAGILLLASLGLLPAQPVRAASILVNSLLDTTVAGDHNCTLREAVTNANTNSETTMGDCAAGSGADTITFSVSGTIPLSARLPLITDIVAGLTVDGTGQSVTISGQNAVEPLLVISGARLTLRTVTL